MVQRFVHMQRHMSLVNTWPWRGWQVCGGSCGLKEG
jgi:hypothetical protein